MKTSNSIVGCQYMRWANSSWMLLSMLTLNPVIHAAEEMPPAMVTQDNQVEALESFLYYLAEFEDEQGNWVDPLTLESMDNSSEVPHE